MRKIKIYFLILAGIAFGMTSCLKKADMNIDPNNTTSSLFTLEYIEGGSGTVINSGLQFFSGGALTFPHSDAFDTAHFNVRYAGPSNASSDLTITVGQDTKALLDNFSNDSIPYEAMPDSLYKIVSSTGTIKAGHQYTSFQVVFYPSKVDITKNYMLAMTVTDAKGVPVSSNFGHIYFHLIGNPIAGGYNWEYIRYNNQAGTGSPTTDNHGSATFAPINPTSIRVPTGYYTAPDYIISFKSSGGVLSNFSAVIDPAEIPAYFTAGGVSVVSGPTIVVSPDLKSFKCNYVAFNGSAFRNITDLFTRP